MRATRAYEASSAGGVKLDSDVGDIMRRVTNATEQSPSLAADGGRGWARIMVPDEGIEPPTFGLQNRCSTAELIRRFKPYLRYQRAGLRARAPYAEPAATVGVHGPSTAVASSMPGQGGMVIATNARGEPPSARN